MAISCIIVAGWNISAGDCHGLRPRNDSGSGNLFLTNIPFHRKSVEIKPISTLILSQIEKKFKYFPYCAFRILSMS